MSNEDIPKNNLRTLSSDVKRTGGGKWPDVEYYNVNTEELKTFEDMIDDGWTELEAAVHGAETYSYPALARPSTSDPLNPDAADVLDMTSSGPSGPIDEWVARSVSGGSPLDSSGVMISFDRQNVENIASAFSSIVNQIKIQNADPNNKEYDENSNSWKQSSATKGFEFISDYFEETFGESFANLESSGDGDWTTIFNDHGKRTQQEWYVYLNTTFDKDTNSFNTELAAEKMRDIFDDMEKLTRNLTKGKFNIELYQIVNQLEETSLLKTKVSELRDQFESMRKEQMEEISKLQDDLEADVVDLKNDAMRDNAEAISGAEDAGEEYTSYDFSPSLEKLKEFSQRGLPISSALKNLIINNDCVELLQLKLDNVKHFKSGLNELFWDTEYLAYGNSLTEHYRELNEMLISVRGTIPDKFFTEDFPNVKTQIDAIWTGSNAEFDGSNVDLSDSTNLSGFVKTVYFHLNRKISPNNQTNGTFKNNQDNFKELFDLVAKIQAKTSEHLTFLLNNENNIAREITLTEDNWKSNFEVSNFLEFDVNSELYNKSLRSQHPDDVLRPVLFCMNEFNKKLVTDPHNFKYSKESIGFLDIDNLESLVKMNDSNKFVLDEETLVASNKSIKNETLQKINQNISLDSKKSVFYNLITSIESAFALTDRIHKNRIIDLINKQYRITKDRNIQITEEIALSTKDHETVDNTLAADKDLRDSNDADLSKLFASLDQTDVPKMKVLGIELDVSSLDGINDTLNVELDLMQTGTQILDNLKEELNEKFSRKNADLDGLFKDAENLENLRKVDIADMINKNKPGQTLTIPDFMAPSYIFGGEDALVGLDEVKKCVQTVSGLSNSYKNVVNKTLNTALEPVKHFIKNFSLPHLENLMASKYNFIMTKLEGLPEEKKENPFRDYVDINNIKLKLDDSNSSLATVIYILNNIFRWTVIHNELIKTRKLEESMNLKNNQNTLQQTQDLIDSTKGDIAAVTADFNKFKAESDADLARKNAAKDEKTTNISSLEDQMEDLQAQKTAAEEDSKNLTEELTKATETFTDYVEQFTQSNVRKITVKNGWNLIGVDENGQLMDNIAIKKKTLWSYAPGNDTYPQYIVNGVKTGTNYDANGNSLGSFSYYDLEAGTGYWIKCEFDEETDTVGTVVPKELEFKPTVERFNLTTLNEKLEDDLTSSDVKNFKIFQTVNPKKQLVDDFLSQISTKMAQKETTQKELANITAEIDELTSAEKEEEKKKDNIVDALNEKKDVSENNVKTLNEELTKFNIINISNDANKKSALNALFNDILTNHGDATQLYTALGINLHTTEEGGDFEKDVTPIKPEVFDALFK